VTAPDAAIVTIGTFDGVHLGHRALLEQVVERARVLGRRSFAVTFYPHPQRVLFGRNVPTLTGPEEKVALIARAGIDDVWLCEFTPELARLEPHDFLQLVAERQPICELWVGADFALGRGRAGTIAVLAEIGGGVGWGLHMVPPLRLDGQVVSSTAIRTLLAAGAVQGAADLLGRPYSVMGELAPGGVMVAADRALPKSLVPYAARVSSPDLDVETEVLIPERDGDARLIEVAAALPPTGPVAITFLHRAS
jgi:riboflavin kinase/FMN adenylyltransferase